MAMCRETLQWMAPSPSHTSTAKNKEAGSAVWPSDSTPFAPGVDRVPYLPLLRLADPVMAAPAEREFERVVLPHLDAAYNLACWLIRDRSIAEEVVQAAVLRALKYFASLRGGDARLWLLRIVRNSAYAILRARCAGIEVPQDGTDRQIDMDIPGPGPDGEMVIAKQEDLTRLNSALAALPVELRECLVLRELEELSYEEIARVADVSIGTVMSRLGRARQALMRNRFQ